MADTNRRITRSRSDIRENQSSGAAAGISRRQIARFFMEKDLFMQGLLGIALLGLMFFSGFIALGTYVLGAREEAFLRAALTAEALVTDVKQTAVTRKSSSSSGANVHYKNILTFEFATQNGEKITTRLNDGQNTVYSAGDRTEILYDPLNPKKIQLAEKRDLPEAMNMISRIAQAVFLCSAAALWFFGRRRKPGVNLRFE